MRAPPPRVSGERLFRALLRLYPPRFRAHYGSAMLDFYRERRHATPAALLWPGLLLNLLTNAAVERLRREVRTPAERITMSSLLRDLRFS